MVNPLNENTKRGYVYNQDLGRYVSSNHYQSSNITTGKQKKLQVENEPQNVPDRSPEEIKEELNDQYKFSMQKLFSDIQKNNLDIQNMVGLNKEDVRKKIPLIEMWKKFEDQEAKGDTHLLKIKSNNLVYFLYFIFLVLSFFVSYNLVFSQNNKVFYNNLGYSILLFFIIFYIIINFDYLLNNYFFKILDILNKIPGYF